MSRAISETVPCGKRLRLGFGIDQARDNAIT
jgi:hypothetical protein